MKSQGISLKRNPLQVLLDSRVGVGKDIHLGTDGPRNTPGRSWEPLITRRHMTTLSSLRHRTEYPYCSSRTCSHTRTHVFTILLAPCTSVSDVLRAYRAVLHWKIYAEIPRMVFSATLRNRSPSFFSLFLRLLSFFLPPSFYLSAERTALEARTRL